MKLAWALVCGALVALALGLAAPSVGALGLSKPPNLENIHMTLGENYLFSVRVYGENRPIEVEMVADNIDFIEFEPQRFTLAAEESREVTCTLSPENLGTYAGSLEARAVSTAPGNPVIGSVGANLRVTVEEPSSEQPSEDNEQPGSGSSSGEGIPAVPLGAAIALVVVALAGGLYLTRWR